ncbi:MAG TPA: TIGR03767 family metallophosphoesterase [Mycobacteriales bacterium]|nr:TIGR03767 family metallophosphoesterase [Mycobacteriales bacterium]
MKATRRTVLKGAAAAAAVAAAGGVQAFPRRSASAAPLARPEGTTLSSTVLRGPAVNAQGYVRLVSGNGEPHVLREDLGTRALPERTARRAPLLTFAHLTDIHVIDAQSPARVEWLDRYDDNPDTATIFSSAYRPQEFLCAQLADSVVRAVARAGSGPVTGVPLAFAICTGDNTDNAQLNETRWQIDLLDGEPFSVNSGDGDFVGVADDDPAFYDVHYYHPHGTPGGVPPGATDDNYRRLHGFPTLEGLLDAAIARFEPTGIGMPWYSCYGNHDGLVQGNFPRTFQFERIALGNQKVVSVSPSQEDLRRLLTGDSAALGAVVTGARPPRTVPADEGRRILTRQQAVEEHFTTSGLPNGHGFTAQNVQDGTAYYVFDPSSRVRGIVLDTVNPNGESSGSLDGAQFAWLRAQLELVSGPGRDRLVVIFSHHTIGTMTNQFPVGSDDPQDFGPRVLGPAVRDLLLQFPNVVLWVNGHTHVNRVQPHTRPDGGGFWEVNTAAHIDFPCQARLMELVDNRDGTLSVFGTIVDADAPLVPPTSVTASTSPAALASVARELAANDRQKLKTDRRGGDGDRNVELLVAAPFALTAQPPAPAAPQQRPGGSTPPLGRTAPSERTLPATGAGAGAVVALGAVGAGAVAARLARGRPDADS